MHTRSLLIATWITRLILLGFLFFMIVAPNLDSLHGKSMGVRIPAYFLLAFAVPILYRIKTIHFAAYPVWPDLLILVALLLDTAGNIFSWYSDFLTYDNYVHFANVFFFTLAVTYLFLDHVAIPIGYKSWIMVGTGTFFAVFWEVFEWVSTLFAQHNMHLTYHDTMWDITNGVLGSFAAALFYFARYRRSTK